MGKGMCAIVRDVSERKRAESVIQEELRPCVAAKSVEGPPFQC